jgi:aldose 1-epimerase
MPVQQQTCLIHSDGEDIYLFTLNNAAGTTVRITNYGAIITSFIIRDSHGILNDIVLGFERP